MKLNVETFDMLCSGLPVSRLPQAFRDAILVTKALGIQYLWIDALCILQDGIDDFHRECAQMSEIYAMSSCNIVATFGGSPHESFFRQRCFESLEIGRRADPSALDAIAPEEYTEAELHDSGVFSRGWIMQELLLAPRTLLFGENQVHWKCAELEACEVWPAGVPHRLSTIIDSGFSKMSFTGNGAFVNWTQIVQRYSKLSLSKEKDKLLALSGIAKFVQRQSGDQYFAGHWKSAFLYSLLWVPGQVILTRQRFSRALDERPSYCRYPNYVAPSWSWASIKGPVRYSHWPLPEHKDDTSAESMGPFRIHDALSSIESISLESVDKDAEDVLGLVVGGQLIIRSPLVSKQQFQHSLSMLPNSPLESGPVGKLCMQDNVWWRWDTEAHASQASTFLTTILVERFRDDSWFTLVGLMLVPTNIENAFTFTREGLFRLDFGNGNMAMCKAALDAAGLEFVNGEGGAVRAKESALETLVIL
ncbi:S-adenosyl-L-methionine-dependent tRNA 4-demethylwyosine synthase [Venturia inaequalis]|nr:S-adenosyl-L-methionine-dependent tRNA 4-demethylwyosine synthase [Venturia inaequalis]